MTDDGRTERFFSANISLDAKICSVIKYDILKKTHFAVELIFHLRLLSVRNSIVDSIKKLRTFIALFRNLIL